MMLQLVSSQEIQGTQSVCFPLVCISSSFKNSCWPQQCIILTEISNSITLRLFFKLLVLTPNAPISTCANHLCPYIPHFSGFSRKINLDTFQLSLLPFSLLCPSSRIAITIILQLLSFLSVITKSGLLVPISWSFQTLKFLKRL